MTQDQCNKCGGALREVDGPRLKFLLCFQCGTTVVLRPRRAAAGDGESAEAAPAGAEREMDVTVIESFTPPAGAEGAAAAAGREDSERQRQRRTRTVTAVLTPMLAALTVGCIMAVVNSHAGKPKRLAGAAPSPRTAGADSGDGATATPEGPAKVRHEEEDGPPPAAGPDGQAAAEAAAELQGTWVFWLQESGKGPEARASGTARNYLVFHGDSVTWRWGENKNWAVGRFKADPTRDPKEIEVALTYGIESGKKRRGIYRMPKNGLLEICWSETGDDRPPAKFAGGPETGAGKGHEILRRADYKESDDVVTDMKKLQGRWAQADKPDASLVVEDDVMTFYRSGRQVAGRFRFGVDPSKSPKEVDMVCTEGNPGGWQLGIYRLHGDRLDLSLSPLGPSPTRPTNFADERSPGGGWTYVSYQSQAK